MGNILVKIDLSRVRERLQHGTQRPWSEIAVRQWLQGAGFECMVMGWIGTPAAVAQLEPDEIVAMQPYDGTNVHAFWRGEANAGGPAAPQGRPQRAAV